jgi:hypothetical protein
MFDNQVSHLFFPLSEKETQAPVSLSNLPEFAQVVSGGVWAVGSMEHGLTLRST